MTNILHLDASARQDQSVSRKLSKRIVDRIATSDSAVIHRDLGKGLAFLDDAMVDSYFTPPENRTPEQRGVIELSDQVTKELLDADILVIGVPIYNFSMPANLKAWCDLVTRVGVTFRYTETGPVGLLKNKRAYVAVVSGGMKIGSDADFLTPWLLHYLKFIGIDDVQMVFAEGVKKTPDESWESAKEQVRALT